MSAREHCALRAPTAFSGRMISIRPENAVMDESKPAYGCFNSRSLIAHGRLFVRAQSAIRADGPPSAQAGSLQLDVSPCLDRYLMTIAENGQT
jgi:hypothetical protein